MVNKTIKDRGITTTTRQVPDTFSFDKTTRQLELIYYYQYCVANGLITVTGEQSRTALILKTYNHKVRGDSDSSFGYSEMGYSEEGYGLHVENSGGFGYSELGYSEEGYSQVFYGGSIGSNELWSDAMREWLQAVIPSGETDLNELWISYFAKHATTPDEQGVTYAGLSMEDAYRKYLVENIAISTTLNPIFSDQLVIQDLIKFKLRKIFSDAITFSDSATMFIGARKLFNDVITITDTILFARKLFFNDSITPSDTTLLKFVKRFEDSITSLDSVLFNNGRKYLFSDSIAQTDSLRYIFIPRFSDSMTPGDSSKWTRKFFFADSMTPSDSAVFTTISGDGYSENGYSEEGYGYESNVI